MIMATTPCGERSGTHRRAFKVELRKKMKKKIRVIT
jgi:hypothetical protein